MTCFTSVPNFIAIGQKYRNSGGGGGAQCAPPPLGPGRPQNSLGLIGLNRALAYTGKFASKSLNYHFIPLYISLGTNWKGFYFPSLKLFDMFDD